MGRAVELISFSAVAPGISGLTMNAVAGDSLTLRDGSALSMLATFARRQASGIQRLTSPLMHDTTMGITNICVPYQTAPAGVLVSLSVDARVLDVAQTLYPQDKITAFGTGSAVAGAIELGGMLVEYGDLPGVDASFIETAELNKRAVNLFSMPVSMTSTGTGAYSAGVAINNSTDLFKANTDYAILGACIPETLNAMVLRLTATDWGNLGIGIPALDTSFFWRSSRWFIELSDMTSSPCIPVFNSANRNRTMLSLLSDQSTGSNGSIGVCMAELSPRGKARK